MLSAFCWFVSCGSSRPTSRRTPTPILPYPCSAFLPRHHNLTQGCLSPFVPVPPLFSSCFSFLGSYGADLVTSTDDNSSVSLFGSNIADCSTSGCSNDEGCMQSDLGVYCACYSSVVDLATVSESAERARQTCYRRRRCCCCRSCCCGRCELHGLLQRLCLPTVFSNPPPAPGV